MAGNTTSADSPPQPTYRGRDRLTADSEPKVTSTHTLLASIVKVLRPPVESAQYTADIMKQACERYGLRRSMGDTGICWDNAGAESLWSTFKHEYYYRHTFAYASELVAAVDNWMHIYNTRRRHSTIGMLSPTNYEKSLTATLMAA